MEALLPCGAIIASWSVIAAVLVAAGCGIFVQYGSSSVHFCAYLHLNMRENGDQVEKSQNFL